ncbi:hypothetical protein [Cryptosporangium aurantiacum]|uniref:Protocatechuate 4,5-dioxygenase, alpha chain n=1 Tax=Cryptosporangium aurantiacum TaxID=134849 RepID=A0A1M7PEA1_9ACTN|nr:hypothetical protein [Cryptosporangium aurantiacum]SHN15249.1 protocatechuate 4,5-dioxygenase, alpha chain [Cryptosporangium aurantiacum]
MSGERYALNRVLWEVCRGGEALERFRATPPAYLAGRALSPSLREALIAVDIRTLFLAGAHPFLLYNFALRLEGGFSLPFVGRYLAQLEGLQTSDLVT